MVRRLALGGALVGLALGPSAVGAPAPAKATVDLLAAARGEIRAVKRTTGVPVLLPRTLLLVERPRAMHVSGQGARRSWVLVVEAVAGCGGANACFVASFEAQRGKALPLPANVRLAGGVRGAYLASRCGASCAPASLWFVRGGVLHAWQVKYPRRPARASLVRMANQALAAGPR